MTQKSWPWSTVAAIGDGVVALSEAISREFLAAWFLVQNFANEGVSKGVGGELAVTGTASPLNVASGSGVCYGMYINDVATTTPAISTPAVGTTGGRVILRTSWAAATTRIAVIKSADGVAAIPALTQVFGTTWEISLATFTITTGGVITVTDARVFRKSTSMVSTAVMDLLSVTTAILNDLAVTTGKIADLAVTTGKIADDAVTDAKLRNSAAISVIGRATNTVGSPADIGGNDGEVLRITATSLGFGTLVAAAYGALSVGTAALADLSVTSGKLGALAVIAGKLADGAVDTAARLASNVVTTAKILDANVTTAKLALLSVTTAIINDLAVTSGKIAANAVIAGKLADGAVDTAARLASNVVTTVKILDANITTAKYALLSVTTAIINDLAVTTAKLALNSVDDTIAGDRVPQFYRRQGGHATNWNSPGTTTYTPGAVRMQGGEGRWTGAADSVYSVGVVFPVAFSFPPLVLITSRTSFVLAAAGSVTANGFTFNGYNPASTTTLVDFDWLAIGPE